MLNTTNTEAKTKSIYDYSFKTLEGKTVKMSDYKGKKILIVNTASECGYTPQYKQLQEIHQKYEKNVVILGFPTNDFGAQEPGSNKDIQTFCQKNYGVTFTIAEKTTTMGNDVHPIIKWLTTKDLNGKMDSKIEWNFNKYLIDEKGNLMEMFKSKVKPDDQAIVSLID